MPAVRRPTTTSDAFRPPRRCSALPRSPLTGSVQARTDAAPPAAPTGLRAFLLRPSEAVTHEFSRTPSFSWLPVRGAMRYEFELSKTPSFSEAGTFWSDEKLKTPAVSVPVALPWLTGNPYAVYARVRAITP